MTSTTKHLRWLDSPAVRRFSAQLRPKWTALQVFRGSAKGYVKTEAAGSPSAGGHPQRRAEPCAAEIVARIPLNAQPHEIADPLAIRESLQMLADRGEAVTIYPAGAIEPVLACILSVHETEPEFTLLLNEGSTLPAGSCTFVTRLDSARFQFELTDDRAALPGAPARVRVAFPSHGLVLNRRATARLETPLAGNYTASFVLFGTPYELQLYDVATGGIGMRCAPRDSPGLHIGRKLQRVRLELNETVVICDLEVRLSRRFRSFLLGEQVQIGCRFVNLSPLMQVAVEKAIGKMTLGRR
ncbi:flagellar brake protein [Pseudoduganella dura]|nr:flagellar brake protein [Pseudoduganella dura]